MTSALKYVFVDLVGFDACVFMQIFYHSFYSSSGAPAGAFGARGRSTIAIEIGNPSSRENLDVTSVRTYVRTYVIRTSVRTD